MDEICSENADNKSLAYSGTNALRQPSTGRGSSQGQEKCSFEEANVEFPSREDVNATVVESETERELSITCQANVKKISNSLCQVTNITGQVVNKHEKYQGAEQICYGS